MAAPARFELGLLAGVGLQKAIEFGLCSPGASEVIVMDLAGVGLDGDWKTPAGQLNEQAFSGLACEQTCGAVDGFD
jgi:hypothetical protein